MIWGLGMYWRCSYVEAQLLVTGLTRKLDCLVAVRYIYNHAVADDGQGQRDSLKI